MDWASLAATVTVLALVGAAPLATLDGPTTLLPSFPAPIDDHHVPSAGPGTVSTTQGPAFPLVTRDNLAPGDRFAADLVLRDSDVGHVLGAMGNGVTLRLVVDDGQGPLSSKPDLPMSSALLIERFAWGDEDLLPRVPDQDGDERLSLHEAAQERYEGLERPGPEGVRLTLELRFDPAAGNELQGSQMRAAALLVRDAAV